MEEKRGEQFFNAALLIKRDSSRAAAQARAVFLVLLGISRPIAVRIHTTAPFPSTVMAIKTGVSPGFLTADFT